MSKYSKSEKGLTLVELLLALTLFGVVSVLIIGVLTNGMKSYRHVNEEISLHDEANAIMTKLVNEIYVATEVTSKQPDSACSPVIQIKDYDDNVTTLEFKDGNAMVDGSAINSSMISINSNNSCFEVKKDSDTVFVKLLAQDNHEKGQKVELKNEISFVNKDKWTATNIADNVLEDFRDGVYTEIVNDGLYNVSSCDEYQNSEKNSCQDRYIKIVDDKNYYIEFTLNTIGVIRNEYRVLVVIYKLNDIGNKLILVEKESTLQISKS